MSPSYVCPCCFLNRISILRESGSSGEQLEIRFNHKDCSTGSNSETKINDNTESNTSLMTQLALSDTSAETLNHLESVLKKLKSGGSFTSGFSDMMQNENYAGETNYISESSIDSSKKTLFLADQIDSVIREQKQFLKDLNLEVPLYEEEWYMLMEDAKLQQKCGDSNWESESTKIKVKSSEQDFIKLLKKGGLADCFYASGDQTCAPLVNTSPDTWKGDSYDDSTFPKINKPTMYFNEEPVKLPKPFQCTLSSNNSNFNKDYCMEKNISVKLLFFPEVALKGSSTSMMSDDCMSSASVYVTAANSIAEQVPAIYTAGDSTSNFQLNTTNSSSLFG